MSSICVYGLYHLGSVTAACLAEAGFTVTGLDDDAKSIAALSSGEPPLFEPGLSDLIKAGIERQKLSFTTDKSAAAADIVWVTFDTPVDEDDKADTGFVLDKIKSIFPHLKNDSVLMVSSQLPVGSVSALQKSFEKVANGRRVHFACSPENLRLGKAIEAFRTQARIVIGCGPEAKVKLEPLFSSFCKNLLWMSVPSAEMSKHAVNSYLAMCVAWTNEIATICEKTGADAAEVERALRAEPRIGTKAYVKAGASFGGGTLARDVRFLESMDKTLPLLGSIIKSNDRHADWPVQTLLRLTGDLKGKKIAMLGLAYKPSTSSLRRSMAVRWCEKLAALGATIQAYDPQVSEWPSKNVTIHKTMEEALHGADALILATEWEQFRTLTAEMLQKHMATPLVLDQGRFLPEALANHPAIHYVSVGRS